MLALQGAPADKSAVARMTASMRHRGPDGEGVYVKGAFGLGFRRLSILDLSHAADQPMVSDDGQFALVFNGEIYNYIELRRELETRGYRFRSTGDTEVLLNAYREWGSKCLERLNGMWAFVVHDQRRGLLFGSRDRFGVKPLYFHRGKNCVLFASEIKAILSSGLYRASPNWNVVAEYLLRHRLDDGAGTFFDGIEHIAPGSSFEIGADGEMRTHRFWTLPQASGDEFADPVQPFAELFEDSVRLRMRSDVPVGVCLSGGLDSTSIICAMGRGWGSSAQPLHAFAYHTAEFDESSYVADTIQATKARLNRLETDPAHAWRTLADVLSFHDEPVHAMSAVIAFDLMALAASKGVKVVLNGHGADEVIGGYSSYFQDYWHSLLASGELSTLRSEIREFTGHHGGSSMRLLLATARRYLTSTLHRAGPYRSFARWNRLRKSSQHSWFAAEITEHARSDADVAANFTLDEALRYSVERDPLPLYLRLEDRNSMAHSVESRLPFLDYRLVSLVFASAMHWKIRGPWNKYILREAMQGRIPESVRTRVDKWGFPVPQGKWISGAWYELIREFLDSREMRERGIYKTQEIRQDLELHRQGKVNVSGKLFAVVQAELWFRQHQLTHPLGV